MERYICIHGHFYQPPRENPWLEAIEIQDSAYPYHDWNERILAECYAPNTASRILDEEGRITKLPNNYAKISFDFGPTLLNWMEEKAPQIYEAIRAADRMSQKNFSGHGSALAQAYNHMILPLANRQDKYTQILWGIRDFEHRFERFPEGMWLPETAVDLETLDIMAELGIQFTILSSHQASEVRALGHESWMDVSDGRIDPTTAYELNLPSGRKINLFFYDGPISRAVSFERLLNRGEYLSQRIMGAFSEDRPWPQLVHIATDGETYGHHQRHGDMALAYALNSIESEKLAQLTNYGEFLERHPPTLEVKIFDNTSWSCVHGVERWWRDCGCNSGGHPGWNQSWRTPLRDSLDWLRDTLVPLYEEHAGRFLKDPWEARNDYIQVVLNRAPENLDQFLDRHSSRELSELEKVTVLKLLGVQRCSMLMYTSCGWFFDELSGIETVQVIQYAGRAISLAEDACGVVIEPGFLEKLEQATSNVPEHRDGRHIYEKFVKTGVMDLMKVAGHYAVSSLFEEYSPHDKIFCYHVDREDFHFSEAGIAKLALGRVRITSEITREAETISFGALHFGEQNLSAGARVFQDEEVYRAMLDEVTASFTAGDFPETIRSLDRHFGASTYSLRSLFRDEQRRVLGQIVESSIEDTRFVYRQAYSHHISMMRFLIDLGVPSPKPFPCTSEFVLNFNLQHAFEEPEISPDTVRNILKEAQALHIEFDAVDLGYRLKQSLERLTRKFLDDPGNLGFLEQLETAVGLVNSLPFEVNLWEVQNAYYEMLHTALPKWRWNAEHGSEEANDWVTCFLGLGRKLSIRVA
jgi:alpha-amylase/alpha-mannosidase (GH57 family)